MSTPLADLRCPRCFRSDIRRDDGSLKPHGRRTGLTRAGWMPCVEATRANATRSGVA